MNASNELFMYIKDECLQWTVYVYARWMLAMHFLCIYKMNAGHELFMDIQDECQQWTVY